MSKNLAVNIKNLSVYYRIYEGILKVIPGLDLFLSEGERIGLVGETGCGKTTLLKSIVRILNEPPAIINKDFIEVCEKSIDGDKGLKNVRENISMVFQDPSTSLNPTLKIYTQMKDILKSRYPEMNKKQYEEIMLENLESVSMPAPKRVLNSYPVELSGGMKQRVSIAMALMKNVKIILADEPTTALDVTIEEQILNLLNKLVKQEKKSLIIVSHALGALRKMTDRIYVMYAGNIVEYGPTKEIFENPKHPYTIGLLAATPKLTGEGISDGIAGDIPSYVNPPEGCRFASRCSRMTAECKNNVPILSPITKEKQQWQAACFNIEN